MVICHYGRKSGKRYHTPVNYAMVDGEIYCAAGFGSVSDWYRNIQANPQVEIWHPDGWFVGLAEESPITEENLPTVRKILVNSGFAARLFGLNPHQLTDEELMEECRGYKLIHLRRTAPRTGRSGPGDLTWVWPVLLLALLCGKKRKKTGKK
jgi:deazaflavin-dependent oxidoreductase (nitroreductase family)